MALVGRREGRNFGFGRQLSYPGPQALKDLFAGGHFATVKAHGDRWQAFVRWCRSEDGPGYNDARQIDRNTLHDYAAYLRLQIQQGELSIATAQNRLSSVNRTVRYDWLGHYLFESIAEVQEHATRWVWTYNYERPTMALGGITPKQKLALVA